MGKLRAIFVATIALFSLLASCSFNYGAEGGDSSSIPDITMNDLSYTRVKDGAIQLRLQATSADRYESKQIMELHDYSFEQFDAHTQEAENTGRGGFAHIELRNLNTTMSDGVSIDVKDEDLVLETDALTYSDTEKTIVGPAGSPVTLTRTDGSVLNGRSFDADMRSRSYKFADGVSGTWVEEEEKTDDEPKNGE